MASVSRRSGLHGRRSVRIWREALRLPGELVILHISWVFVIPVGIVEVDLWFWWRFPWTNPRRAAVHKQDQQPSSTFLDLLSKRNLRSNLTRDFSTELGFDRFDRNINPTFGDFILDTVREVRRNPPDVRLGPRWFARRLLDEIFRMMKSCTFQLFPKAICSMILSASSIVARFRPHSSRIIVDMRICISDFVVSFRKPSSHFSKES